MSDAEYLTLRARQELSAAVGASDARVRQIHLELADAYAFRVREMKREVLSQKLRVTESAA